MDRRHEAHGGRSGRQLLRAAFVMLALAVLLSPAYLRGREGTAPAAEPRARELGQTVEGCGSANFSWLKQPDARFGVAFTAPKTGTVTAVLLPWKRSGNYGGGTFGRFAVELQTDGPEHFASGEVVARAGEIVPDTAMDGRLDGTLRVPITAELTAGRIYHLVIANVDPAPARNWSSPNTLMTRVQAWDGTGSRVAAFVGGRWTPWSSGHPAQLFNAARRNDVSGARCPLLLIWADGAHTGDPYYSAAVARGAYWHGERKAGQRIVWQQPDATITRIGLSAGKIGRPGTLRYTLEQEDGTALASGRLAAAADIGAAPTWVYATLPAPVILRQGQAYRLWFASPDSPNRENCFFQHVPYGDQRPPEWLASGWGGTDSCYLEMIDGAWVPRVAGDLSFSLQ